ncbi:LCP family protein [Virgibacillus sp. MSJ-26]|uniref:LCP family protein n=1 Tax=Virgibacillus sp. MSJ-26 TaxID=2841522 RepID=UPI001C1045F1|nr:LCP family protein [Virgibacillus sp. MSJ-26]MBU5465350.1 LCP family protein [Virgibacillus sp. MSJ-26]
MNVIKRSKKKWIWITVSIILILLISGGAYAAHLYNKTSNVIEESHEKVGRDNEHSALREEAVDPIEDNVTVLFLGVDTSEERAYEEKSRTDAMLVATFNKDEGTVKLLSIPRDTYVYVPEIGYNTKINHAHFHGGPKASVETVEDYLNVPIDYYVSLNFEAFIEVVDSLNGITYDVPYEMEEMDSKDKTDAIHLYPGRQKLDGEEALALVRTRKYDSDIERGKRQQEVIEIIADKVTSASSIFKLNQLIEAIRPNLKTDLYMNDIKSFMEYGLDKDFNIEKINLEGDGDYMDDGLWYFHADEDSLIDVQRELRNHLDLPAYSSDDDDEYNEYDDHNDVDNNDDSFQENNDHQEDDSHIKES